MADQVSRRRRAVLFFAVALAVAGLVGGCSSSTSPDSATATMTETFNGVLNAGGFDTHGFNVSNTGNLDATLTSISPQNTITVGFGVGQPSTSGCSLISYTESAHVGSDLSGTISPGSYCVTIYDVGNVQGSVSYVVTVTHP